MLQYETQTTRTLLRPGFFFKNILFSYLYIVFNPVFFLTNYNMVQFLDNTENQIVYGKGGKKMSEQLRLLIESCDFSKDYENYDKNREYSNYEYDDEED